MSRTVFWLLAICAASAFAAISYESGLADTRDEYFAALVEDINVDNTGAIDATSAVPAFGIHADDEGVFTYRLVQDAADATKVEARIATFKLTHHSQGHSYYSTKPVVYETALDLDKADVFFAFAHSETFTAPAYASAASQGGFIRLLTDSYAMLLRVDNVGVQAVPATVAPLRRDAEFDWGNRRVVVGGAGLGGQGKIVVLGVDDAGDLKADADAYDFGAFFGAVELDDTLALVFDNGIRKLTYDSDGLVLTGVTDATTTYAQMLTAATTAITQAAVDDSFPADGADIDIQDHILPVGQSLCMFAMATIGADHLVAAFDKNAALVCADGTSQTVAWQGTVTPGEPAFVTAVLRISERRGGVELVRVAADHATRLPSTPIGLYNDLTTYDAGISKGAKQNLILFYAKGDATPEYERTRTDDMDYIFPRAHLFGGESGGPTGASDGGMWTAGEAAIYVPWTGSTEAPSLREPVRASLTSDGRVYVRLQDSYNPSTGADARGALAGVITGVVVVLLLSAWALLCVMGETFAPLKVFAPWTWCTCKKPKAEVESDMLDDAPVAAAPVTELA